MKSFLILIALINCLYSHAESLEYRGEKFEIKKLGNKFYVFAGKPQLIIKNEAFNENRAKSLDCDALDRSLRQIQNDLNRCREDNSEIYCNRSKRQIERLAKKPSVRLGDSKQSWKIYPTSQYDNFTKEEFAKKLRVEPNQVKLMLADPLAANASLNLYTWFANENSRTEMISDILSYHNVITPHEFESGFYTHNRIFACDILTGDVEVRLEYENNFGHAEPQPLPKKKIAFHLLKKLEKIAIDTEETKIVQAALLGSEMGHILSQNKFLSVKEAFKKLINTQGNNLEIRNFSNQAQFEEEVFPDLYFNHEFVQQIYLEAE